MTKYALDSLDEHPEIAEALGNLIVAWAYAEDHLVVALHCVSGMPVNMALAVYHHAHTFDTRIKLILAALAESKIFRDAHKRVALETILDKLSKMSYQRNHYIHGAWQIDNTSKTVVLHQMRAEASSTRRSKVVKASDIRQHTAAVLGRVKALHKIAGAISEI